MGVIEYPVLLRPLDSDEDGLCNVLEVTKYGTDPYNPDTDGDGTLDGEEAFDISVDHADDETSETTIAFTDEGGSELLFSCAQVPGDDDMVTRIEGFEVYKHMQGLWHMDEASWQGVDDEVVNSVIDQLHGTSMGGAMPDDEYVLSGFAANLDGIDDYIEIPDESGVDLSGDMTICFWVRPDSLDQPTVDVIEKFFGGEFGITLMQDGGLIYTHGEAHDAVWSYWYLLPAGSIRISEWSHVALVRNADKQIISVYLNGEKKREVSYLGEVQPSLTTYPIRFGYGYQYGRYFDGCLDEISLFDAVLSDQMIGVLYQGDSASIDADGDGWLYDWEIANGFNPHRDDRITDDDDDTLSNKLEYEMETDHTNPDTDHDGWNDNLDPDPRSQAVIDFGSADNYSDRLMIDPYWPVWMEKMTHCAVGTWDTSRSAYVVPSSAPTYAGTPTLFVKADEINGRNMNLSFKSGSLCLWQPLCSAERW